MKWISRSSSLMVAVLLLVSLAERPACCLGYGSSQFTVAGPEATDLLGKIPGQILISEGPLGCLTDLDVPTVKSTRLTVIGNIDAHDPPVIKGLSGPDQQGRIVFLEDHHFVQRQERHLLRAITSQGQEATVIFSGPGNVLWDDAVSQRIALAAIGGNVACITKLQPVEMRNPDTFLQCGKLEIWNIATQAQYVIAVTALDEGLSWFPDGKRLAYVELVSNNARDPGTQNFKDFGKDFKAWAKVPVTIILDTSTGKKSRLHLGWNPVVSSDGKCVLVEDLDWERRLIDLTTGKSQPVRWPGAYGPAIALIEGKYVVYWGLPTSGTGLRYTTNNSPLVGKKLMLTLKVAELNTNKFQTIVPYLDPRTQVSFGGTKSLKQTRE